ncbi:MAG: hypothetical protein ACKOA0_01345, partial [Burkholderiaceae bacterium]
MKTMLIRFGVRRALLLWLLLLSLPSAVLIVLSTTPRTAVANAATVKQMLPEASVMGSGSFRWLGLKLYDASLWVDRSNFNPETWQRAPLALELNYARSLDGKRIAD